MRLEIVTAVEIPRPCARLRAAGPRGFSIVDRVRGEGDRGRQDGDDVTGELANGCVATTRARGQPDAVVAAIRPVLREFGGECLVFEVQRIQH